MNTAQTEVRHFRELLSQAKQEASINAQALDKIRQYVKGFEKKAIPVHLVPILKILNDVEPL